VARLELCFDCTSPWIYLAFHEIADVAREAGAELVYGPIRVGGSLLVLVKSALAAAG
jgi:2-hydroxychromene-2-carboxylate isomerase